MLRLSLLGLVALGAITAFAADKQLPSLPDAEGFAGSFAGVSRGMLLVAGGANFPDKKPWEDGKKVWYDSIFLLDSASGKWVQAGKLPRPLGYGVSVTHRTGVVCVGGSDATRHHAEAFRLEWQDGKVATSPLPPLPVPLANAAGALVGDTLYIVGGLEKPDSARPSSKVYRMDLAGADPKWQEVEGYPGPPRMLALAAGVDGAFYLVGGVDLVTAEGRVERRYLKDGHRYTPGTGWKRIADLPFPLAAAPAPAPRDARGFYALGGDDGSRVGFMPPEKHPGFRKTVLRYDIRQDRWQEVGTLPVARVTVPCVTWNGTWIVPSGESRPGVRSPEVWSIAPLTPEP
jgi:N-acetylneuraminic acid mutarotase